MLLLCYCCVGPKCPVSLRLRYQIDQSYQIGNLEMAKNKYKMPLCSLASFLSKLSDFFETKTNPLCSKQLSQEFSQSFPLFSERLLSIKVFAKKKSGSSKNFFVQLVVSRPTSFTIIISPPKAESHSEVTLSKVRKPDIMNFRKYLRVSGKRPLPLLICTLWS